jgi:hypothetical protein
LAGLDSCNEIDLSIAVEIACQQGTHIVTSRRKNEPLSPFDPVPAATGFCKNVQKASPRDDRWQSGSLLSLQNIFCG